VTPRITTYEQFRKLARRHPPQDLLPVLARISLAQQSVRKPMDRRPYPWITSMLARENIAYSNEHRRSTKVTDKFIRQVHNTGLNLRDPFIEEVGTEGALDSWMVRTLYQQIPYQAFNPYAETARLLAVCGGDDQRYQALGLQTVSEQAWTDALGMPLIDFVRTAFTVTSIAQMNGGCITPATVNQAELDSVNVSKDDMLHVLHGFMAADLPELRDRAKSGRNANPDLRHLDFNPLVGTPFVGLGDGRYVAPVWEWAQNRTSLFALHFAVKDAFGKEFPSEFGSLVESYVGDQLRQVTSSPIGEQPYGRKNGLRTCDWVVPLGTTTLVIEVKTALLAHSAKLDVHQHIAALESRIGKALNQIRITAELIKSDNPVFAEHHLPKNTFGIVITADHYFTANSDHYREPLPDPGMPYAVMTLQELEWFVATLLSGVEPAAILKRLSSGATSPEAEFTAAAGEAGIEIAPNPLVDSHFDLMFAGLVPEIFDGMQPPAWMTEAPRDQASNWRQLGASPSS
jgi:hypothetical protein